ncbi:hypothetical protein KY290_017565 [Solanum tuberosum]|uniref:Uncharacterized protein n=1 Tax=Solanum tuberosum TaxID=4113 RepID=A0ABQ7VBM8_SOLTU|nr:hypothetical protein KY290_017565 [Solanum tuberosum]
MLRTPRAHPGPRCVVPLTLPPPWPRGAVPRDPPPRPWGAVPRACPHSDSRRRVPRPPKRSPPTARLLTRPRGVKPSPPPGLEALCPEAPPTPDSRRRTPRPSHPGLKVL